MGYGVFSYPLPCSNLGNEIQSIAASGFYEDGFKLIPFIVNSERDRGEACRLISNAYYFSFQFFQNCFPQIKSYEFLKEQYFGMNEKIVPLLVSMHISKRFSTEKRTLIPSVKNTLLKYGPVGTRDYSTLALLEEQGIPAYFSGCLTLTLNKRQDVKKEDYILVCSCSEELVRFIKSKTERPVYDFSYFVEKSLDTMEGFYAAEYLLNRYQAAHCVVTNRLHAAMPCLALETPVFLTYKKNSRDFGDVDDLNQHPRYSGLAELTNYASEDYYMENYEMFDVDNPPMNSNKYLKLRKNLIERCNDFLQKDSAYEEGINRKYIFEKIKRSESSFDKNKILFNLLDDQVQGYVKRDSQETEKHIVQDILHNRESIIVFGTGRFSKKIAHLLKGKVRYYVDNNKSRWGELDNKVVTSPLQLLKEERERVCILICVYDAYDSIKEQLQSMGFQKNLHFFDGRCLI